MAHHEHLRRPINTRCSHADAFIRLTSDLKITGAYVIVFVVRFITCVLPSGQCLNVQGEREWIIFLKDINWTTHARSAASGLDAGDGCWRGNGWRHFQGFLLSMLVESWHSSVATAFYRRYQTLNRNRNRSCVPRRLVRSVGPIWRSCSQPHVVASPILFPPLLPNTELIILYHPCCVVSPDMAIAAYGA